MSISLSFQNLASPIDCVDAAASKISDPSKLVVTIGESRLQLKSLTALGKVATVASKEPGYEWSRRRYTVSNTSSIRWLLSIPSYPSPREVMSTKTRDPYRQENT
jgi:hypothetical protein